jgi:hypothetical protein
MDAGDVRRRYGGPLRAYVSASSLRLFGDADSLVDGFLAARLSSARDLTAWREGALPLRRWLVKELLLHARELQRAARKASGACDGCGCATPCEVGLEPQAFEGFERAWSRALLSDACAVAERELVAEGDGDAWHAFRRHFLEGVACAALGAELRIGAAEARARVHRASSRVERALRVLLEQEGVDHDVLDDELAWLMEVSGR